MNYFVDIKNKINNSIVRLLPAFLLNFSRNTRDKLKKIGNLKQRWHRLEKH